MALGLQTTHNTRKFTVIKVTSIKTEDLRDVTPYILITATCLQKHITL
jgi:hypothetical protein